MSNKRRFVFDELRDAEALLAEGFEDGLLRYDRLERLAKYYRTECNFGAKRIERALVEFCLKEDPDFNPITESEQVRKWVLSAMKYPLRAVPFIAITRKEVEVLKSIPEYVDRKVLFVMLVIAKAEKKKEYDTYAIRVKHFSDIARYCVGRRRLTEDDVAQVIHANNKGKQLITSHLPTRKFDVLHIVNFAENIPPGKVVITVSDPEEYLKNEYDDFFGRISHNCANCGKEIVKTVNNRKYCDKCAKAIKLRQNREGRKKVKSS